MFYLILFNKLCDGYTAMRIELLLTTAELQISTDASVIIKSKPHISHSGQNDKLTICVLFLFSLLRINSMIIYVDNFISWKSIDRNLVTQDPTFSKLFICVCILLEILSLIWYWYLIIHLYNIKKKSLPTSMRSHTNNKEKLLLLFHLLIYNFCVQILDSSKQFFFHGW